MRVEITTIDEEFEKSEVKGFVRTKKGKLERVNPFSRKGEKKEISSELNSLRQNKEVYKDLVDFWADASRTSERTAKLNIKNNFGNGRFKISNEDGKMQIKDSHTGDTYEHGKNGWQ